MPASRYTDIFSLRHEIAIAAARMIAEEGASYDTAKRKAARMLLGTGRIAGEILPDNKTIENEVRLYYELFHPDDQPARLARDRKTALSVMKKLKAFNPYITGAVLNGTAGIHSDIHLQLFTDDVKAVEIFLLNSGIEFDVSTPQKENRGNSGAETIRFCLDEKTICLTVYATDDIRRPKKFFGPHSERADTAELEMLIDRNSRKG